MTWKLKLFSDREEMRSVGPEDEFRSSSKHRKVPNEDFDDSSTRQ